jgi:hypothetical protein
LNAGRRLRSAASTIFKGAVGYQLLPLLGLRARPRPAAAAGYRPSAQRFGLLVGEVELANAFALVREGDSDDGAFAVGDLLAALIGYTNCLASHVDLL